MHTRVELLELCMQVCIIRPKRLATHKNLFLKTVNWCSPFTNASPCLAVGWVIAKLFEVNLCLHTRVEKSMMVEAMCVQCSLGKAV